MVTSPDAEKAPATADTSRSTSSRSCPGGRRLGRPVETGACGGGHLHLQLRHDFRERPPLGRLPVAHHRGGGEASRDARGSSTTPEGRRPAARESGRHRGARAGG
ncbi:hypothetical protein QJS66_12695 [Kocuria rhizophila]|nr:hypothetical protein QJS66_12695 [Kocuria rhizophila]